MENRQYEYPNTLSGGEQQRVTFARAVANSPDIILADEPTGNLDSRNGEKIIERLRELNNGGTTVIAVSHDQRLIDEAQTKINIEDISCV
ncbi:MAG: ATP-binding cassette domain-containing protein [Clostridiales bacterium]|jgi:putative ABC transport system ATP-binding protein|nr:ATP-binding cassette domain-containing protein [Clostridiales bacterium]